MQASRGPVRDTNVIVFLRSMNGLHFSMASILSLSKKAAKSFSTSEGLFAAAVSSTFL